MAVNHTISLVLPAHNEEANLEPVVREALAVLPALFRDCEIVVVDDGSRDATPAIADRLATEDPRVRVVHHPRNRGYGAALQSGFAAARRELIMLIHADRQLAVRHAAPPPPPPAPVDIVARHRTTRNAPSPPAAPPPTLTP